MDKVAETMQLVGYEKGMVVYGKDDATGAGMDEISISGETQAIEFSSKRHQRITIAPEDAGLKRAHTESILSTQNLQTEADRFIKVLSGEGFPACIDFTCLNAGAILYTAGKCTDLKTGVARCKETIESGRAIQKLREWRAAQGNPLQT